MAPLAASSDKYPRWLPQALAAQPALRVGDLGVAEERLLVAKGGRSSGDESPPRSMCSSTDPSSPPSASGSW